MLVCVSLDVFFFTFLFPLSTNPLARQALWYISGHFFRTVKCVWLLYSSLFPVLYSVASYYYYYCHFFLPLSPFLSYRVEGTLEKASADCVVKTNDSLGLHVVFLLLTSLKMSFFGLFPPPFKTSSQPFLFVASIRRNSVAFPLFYFSLDSAFSFFRNVSFFFLHGCHHPPGSASIHFFQTEGKRKWTPFFKKSLPPWSISLVCSFPRKMALFPSISLRLDCCFLALILPHSSWKHQGRRDKKKYSNKQNFFPFLWKRYLDTIYILINDGLRENFRKYSCSVITGFYSS